MTSQSTKLPSEPWIIDVHQHFIPDLYRRALKEANVDPFAIPPWAKWSPQMALDFMDQRLIKKGIVSITDPGVNFGDNIAARKLAREVNEIAADLAQQHPQRFGGFASLPLPDVDGALEEITYSLDVLKLDGVVLLSSQCDGTYLGDAKFDSVMDELNTRKATVFVHPASPQTSKGILLDMPTAAVEYVFDTTRAILNIVWSGTAHRCPDIDFIFSHAGGTLPFVSWRASSVIDNIPVKEKHFPLGAMEYLRRFNYDLALSSSEQAIAALQQLVPNKNILFGSDFPFAPDPMPALNTKLFNQTSFFSNQDRLLIGSETPLRLLSNS